MTAITWQITNVLGEARPVTMIWPDGSYICPWCGSAVVASEGPICFNPACWAGKWAHVEWIIPAKAKAEARAKEKAERQRNHRWAMERIEEENRARRERWLKFGADVLAKGGCLLCSDEYRKKVRRHRGACPKESR